jgi:hypothetical protein
MSFLWVFQWLSVRYNLLIDSLLRKENEFFEFLDSKLLIFSVIYSTFFGPKNSKNSFWHLNCLIISDISFAFWAQKTQKKLKKTHYSLLYVTTNTLTLCISCYEAFQHFFESHVKSVGRLRKKTGHWSWDTTIWIHRRIARALKMLRKSTQIYSRSEFEAVLASRW